MEKVVVEGGSCVVSVKQGDTIFADFVTAGTDSSKFPDALRIKLDRPDEDYIHHGRGPHSCLGRPIVTTAAAIMIRVFARLGNLRRALGPACEMRNKVVAVLLMCFCCVTVVIGDPSHVVSVRS